MEQRSFGKIQQSNRIESVEVNGGEISIRLQMSIDIEPLKKKRHEEQKLRLMTLGAILKCPKMGYGDENKIIESGYRSWAQFICAADNKEISAATLAAMVLCRDRAINIESFFEESAQIEE